MKSLEEPATQTGSFASCVVFYWLADIKKMEIPHLTVLGMNPLVIYIVQNKLMVKI